MFIVDSHCHLNFNSLQAQLPEIIKHADVENVKLMQTICTKISEFSVIQDIVEKNHNVFCSIGVHPNEVENEGIVDTETLKNFTKHPKVIGIGETGLDYYRENFQRQLQHDSFINHINVSRETSLPIIIHNRSSDNDMIKILNNEMLKGSFKGLIHSFSSSKELAYKALDLGLYISISGIITFKNAQNLRDIVKNLPLDKLLVETDSPYLAPEPMRGKTNEPAFTIYVVRCLAELFNKKIEEIARTTTLNFFSLFDKASVYHE